MRSSRRSNLSLYQRSASPINLPPHAGRSLTSYRNKFLAILAVASLYSSFLYQHGQFLLFLRSHRRSSRHIILHRLIIVFSLYPTGGASTYLGGVTPDRTIEKSAKEGLAMMKSLGRRLAISSWNIAAINNNPWEYWITYPDEPEYDQLMKKIEDFIIQPGEKDLAVHQVFSEEMFTKLDSRMTGVGWKTVRPYWEKDFRDRKIVSGFLKVSSIYAFVTIQSCQNAPTHIFLFIPRIRSWEASV